MRSLVHAALGLEEEDVVEVCGGVGVAHGGAGEGPLLERCAPFEAAMGGVVILALDPRPEAAVQRLEAVGELGIEVGEPAGAKGSEPALDLSLSRGMMRSCVDEGDAELGADQGELAGAVVGAVVDIEALGDAAAE